MKINHKFINFFYDSEHLNTAVYLYSTVNVSSGTDFLNDNNYKNDNGNNKFNHKNDNKTEV